MNFLKTALTAVASLIIGIAIAGYFTGVNSTSPLSSIENVFTSFKQSMGNALLGNTPQFSAPNAVPHEGYPTPGVTMTPAEISGAQEYFNKLSGVDMDKKKKEEEKEKKEKKEKDDKKNKEEEIKAPSSLFPVLKKRKHLEDSDTMTTGAVYAIGTSPYGPPPDVKAKIFDLDSLLYIDNDPNAAFEDYRDQNTPYRKPTEPLPLEKKIVPETAVSPPLDHSNAFTIQLGAFENREGAEKLKQKLFEKGYNVSVYKTPVAHKVFYCVRLNKAMTQEVAANHKNNLIKDGIPSLVVPMHKE